MTQPIHLLPHPKDFTLGEGMFSLDVNTSILIPARAGDKALFVARQLQDEICQSTYVPDRIHR